MAVCHRSPRSGLILFEVVIALTILGVIFGVCVMALVQSVRMERAGTAALIDTQVLHRLSRRLSADIHAAAGIGDFEPSVVAAGLPPIRADRFGIRPLRLVLRQGTRADRLVVYEAECDSGGAITGLVRLEIVAGEVRSRVVTAVALQGLSWEGVFEGDRAIGVRTRLRLLRRDPRARALNDREWFAAFRVEG
ncbi:MAG: hypothetical protein HYY93_11345 [Planctomycetes bacterium]|nr:hypothetical protein [Planctomycetota bacterium]